MRVFPLICRLKHLFTRRFGCVSLKFTPERLRVYDEFTDAVTTDAQGNLYVSVDLPDHGVLFSYLLSFGDSVEVLEPASVREQVKEKLISMLHIYKT